MSAVSEASRRKAVRDQCKIIKDRIDKQYGHNARELVGERFYRALLAEGLVNWFAQIDETVSKEALQAIIAESHAWLHELMTI